MAKYIYIANGHFEIKKKTDVYWMLTDNSYILIHKLDSIK